MAPTPRALTSVLLVYWSTTSRTLHLKALVRCQCLTSSPMFRSVVMSKRKTPAGDQTANQVDPSVSPEQSDPTNELDLRDDGTQDNPSDNGPPKVERKRGEQF